MLITLLPALPPLALCWLQVEQSRFVVRPYSMGDAEAVDEPPETPPVAGATPRTMARCVRLADRLGWVGRRPVGWEAACGLVGWLMADVLPAVLPAAPQKPPPSSLMYCLSHRLPPCTACRTTTFLTYSGRRSQDLKDFTRRSLDRLAAVAEGGAFPEGWPEGAMPLGGTPGVSAAAALQGATVDAEFLDAVSRRMSLEEGVAAAAVLPEEVAAVRAALAKQQAREVPEDERWAVQVRARLWAGAMAGMAPSWDGPVVYAQVLQLQTTPTAHHRRPSPCLTPSRRHRLQGTAARRYWSCPGNTDLRVRGRSYLTDRRKIPAAMPMFDLYRCWSLRCSVCWCVRVHISVAVWCCPLCLLPCPCGTCTGKPVGVVCVVYCLPAGQS